MDDIILKAHKKVDLYFYVTFAVALVLILVGYGLNKYTLFCIPAKNALILSTFTMLYLVSSIPAVLWFCNKKISMLNGVEDQDLRYIEYVKWIKIRVLFVGSNLWINILLYYSLHTVSFFYAAGIGVITLFFCKPNKTTIEKELNPTPE